MLAMATILAHSLLFDLSRGKHIIIAVRCSVKTKRNRSERETPFFSHFPGNCGPKNSAFNEQLAVFDITVPFGASL